MGPNARADPRTRDARRRLERRLPVRHRPPPARRRRAGPGAAHHLRRRARLGAARPDRVGRRGLRGADRRRPRPRPRRRRLPRHREPAPRKGLPRLGRRHRPGPHAHGGRPRLGGQAAHQPRLPRPRRGGGAGPRRGVEDARRLHPRRPLRHALGPRDHPARRRARRLAVERRLRPHRRTPDRLRLRPQPRRDGRLAARRPLRARGRDRAPPGRAAPCAAARSRPGRGCAPDLRTSLVEWSAGRAGSNLARTHRRSLHGGGRARNDAISPQRLARPRARRPFRRWSKFHPAADSVTRRTTKHEVGHNGSPRRIPDRAQSPGQGAARDDHRRPPAVLRGAVDDAALRAGRRAGRDRLLARRGRWSGCSASRRRT